MTDSVHAPEEQKQASFMEQAGIVRQPPFFGNIRSSDWQPRFHWEKTASQAAEAINLPHEDYPRRVTDTERAIIHVMTLNRHGNLRISQDLIRDVHRRIFQDHRERAGEWRRMNVRVGHHIPPRWDLIEPMMHELEQCYLPRQLHLQDLGDWYFDFETIHPFVDGNGRVGGVIIAALSYPKWQKFLSPGQ